MARRGRRVAVGLTVVFVVLVGVLVAVDRVGAWAAERTVAEKVSQEMKDLGASSGEPDVTVGGFPFLNQVLDGRYEEIRVVLRNVSADNVTVPELDIHATGVNAEMNTLMSGDGPITADRVAGTATVGYESVRALVDRPGLELAEENGKLRLRLPLSVADRKITAIAVADVAVADGLVKISVADIRAEGVELLPPLQRLLDAYKSRLSVALKLPPLPFRLKLEGVRALPEGLAVTASAQAVPIAS